MDKRKSPPRIGVFDSGLGGLTVLRALRRLVPHADYHYVGDTARLPYGTKSDATIRRYGFEISNYLAQEPLDALVIACNTVSAVAVRDLQAEFSFPVTGMVEAGAAEAAGAAAGSQAHRIGVICTPATMRSGAYERALAALNPALIVSVKACPLFVPLVEEGWTAGPIVQGVIDRYLAPFKADKIDTLVLGCTHYPLLKEALLQYFGGELRIVSSGLAAAQQLAGLFPAASGAVDSGVIATTGTIKIDLTDPPAPATRALIERFLGEVAPEPGTLALDRLEKMPHAPRAAATPPPAPG